VFALAALAACKFHSTGVTTDGNDGDTMLVDALDAPPDAQACFGTGTWQVCLASAPTDPPVLLPGIVDTDSYTGCIAQIPDGWAANQGKACIVVSTSFTISSNVHVKGSVPLVLVAADTLTVDADLDGSSHNGSPGPGHTSTLCDTTGTQPQDGSGSIGGGGGAGGSFMTPGGDGGKGDNGSRDRGSAVAADGNPPAVLRGGCDGQQGGDGNSAGTAGGVGGGALYLLAGNAITLTGNAQIAASGQGGRIGAHYTGGAGGGSGGMIVFWAPMITAMATAKITANGGGGAAGADNNTSGDAGSDPVLDSPSTPAPPGQNVITGGRGYALGNGAGTGNNSGGSSQGGGGGGGGGGYVRTNVSLTTLNNAAEVSPAEDVVP
jgi:hypothetical protein